MGCASDRASVTAKKISTASFAASFVYAYTQELLAPDKPIIYAYSHSPREKKNSVLSDDYNGAEQAVRHLASLGHTRIGFINGPPDVIPSQNRFRGYCAALENHGIAFDRVLLKHGIWEKPESGYAAATELLALTDPPTAIFAANDVMAAGVIDAVHALGLRVPDDVSVIGYDDRDMAKFLKPALTTVRLPMAQIGSTAAERLIRCVEEGASLVDSVFIRCELIVRDSCGECSRPDLSDLRSIVSKHVPVPFPLLQGSKVDFPAS